jgi:hypothetical protein
MGRHSERDLLALNNFRAREDSVKYTTLLRKILELFGLGIIDSLEYTLSKYLRQTNGALANEIREDWEEKAVEGMLCPNNHAERPFAILRAYNRTYPSISLHNLAKLSQTIASGTHRPADKGYLAGAAINSDARLRAIVGQLCGVQNRRVGLITVLLRAAHCIDNREMIKCRKRMCVRNPKKRPCGITLKKSTQICNLERAPYSEQGDVLPLIRKLSL